MKVIAMFLIEYYKDASFSPRNYSGDLIVGIRSLCGRFRDYRFDYIGSEGNVKAHKMASWHVWDQNWVSLEKCPDFKLFSDI